MIILLVLIIIALLVFNVVENKKKRHLQVTLTDCTHSWYESDMKWEEKCVDVGESWKRKYDQMDQEWSRVYAALDTGMRELEENYQQELLTEYEKVETLANATKYWEQTAGELEQIRVAHEIFCLPILGTDIYPMSEDESDTPVFNLMWDEALEYGLLPEALV